MSYKDRCQVLFLVADPEKGRDIQNEYEGSCYVGGDQVSISSIFTSPMLVKDKGEDSVLGKFFTTICFFYDKPEDIPLLAPFFEVYSALPIKLILHSSSVTIPKETNPTIPRIMLGDKKLFFSIVKAENIKLQTQLMNVFKSLDKDNSGFLDLQELMQASLQMGTEISKEEAETALDKLDTDGDKKVSFEEFAHWWQSGRKLFGVSMKNIIMKQLKKSSYVNEKLSKGKEDVKYDATNRVMGSSHVGLNKEEICKTQAVLKLTTNGPEYTEISKKYCPLRKPGSYAITLLLHCKSPEASLPQVEKIVNSLLDIYDMMHITEFKTSELKPTIKVKEKAVLLELEIKLNEDNDEMAALAQIGLLFPVLKISGQCIEFSLKFASDLGALATEKRPAFAHILDGFALDLKTQALKTNVDTLMLMISSFFREREIVPKIMIQTLAFGQISVKLKAEDKLLDTIVKFILKMIPPLATSVPEFKESEKAKILKELSYAPPFIHDILYFLRNQLEGIEVALASDDYAGSLAVIVPGLGKLLTLN